MPNKMLIDAAHPEETRVVVLRGNRVEEFDFESASRKQLRGNIYLAKVTRVEPSLQAAFVDYGGNRHGFLAFSEIHPDYYQIPVADRQALIEAEEAEIAEAEARANERERGGGRGRGRSRGGRKPEAAADASEGSTVSEAPSGEDGGGNAEHTAERPSARDRRRAGRDRQRGKRRPARIQRAGAVVAEIPGRERTATATTTAIMSSATMRSNRSAPRMRWRNCPSAASRAPANTRSRK